MAESDSGRRPSPRESAEETSEVGLAGWAALKSAESLEAAEKELWLHWVRVQARRRPDGSLNVL